MRVPLNRARAFAMIGAFALTGASISPAHADECTAVSAKGLPFATCFDPGNRVYASAASNGLGFGVDVRHRIDTDDPDVSWRLEHAFVSLVGTTGELAGALYAGRFVRHARDGHVLLPIGPPRKIFVPFDIGAEVEVGRVRRRLADDRFHVSAVRAAVLLELGRSADFRRRFAVGPVTRWDIVVPDQLSSVDEHRVTPFSAGLLDIYLESKNGLTTASFRIEAGGMWSGENGWRGYLDAEAGLERVLIAINDQPLSLYASAAHKRGAVVPVSDVGDQSGAWQVAAGARLALSWAKRGP